VRTCSLFHGIQRNSRFVADNFRNVDKKMVNIIMNEIIDHGPRVVFEDIGEYVHRQIVGLQFVLHVSLTTAERHAALTTSINETSLQHHAGVVGL